MELQQRAAAQSGQQRGAGRRGQSQPAPAQQDTQLATLLKASQAAQLRGVLEHARELAQVQAEAAAMRREITELKRALAGANASEGASAAEGAGAGSRAGGGSACGDDGLQLHAAHQPLLQVKQEQGGMGEQLADKDTDKDELCGEVLLLLSETA